jgi:hypothetical protein
MKSAWTFNIHLIKKIIKRGARRKNKYFLWVGISGRGVGTRKRGLRVNMADVFCIHI